MLLRTTEAGTDLPNFGFRDSWQPFLGEVRTYAQQEYYRANANYERSEHRVRFIKLFERAIRQLK